MTAHPKPPTRLAPTGHRTTTTPGPVGRQTKRAALGQCGGCGAAFTAMVRGDRIVAVDIPATPDRGYWFHRDCGGRIHAFDIDGGGPVEQ